MFTEGQLKAAPRLIAFHSADGRTEKVQVELLPVIEKVCVMPNPVDQRSSIRTPLAGNASRRHKQAIPDHPQLPGGSVVQFLVRLFDALEMPCAVLAGSDQILLGKEPPSGAFGTVKVIRCDLLCVLEIGQVMIPLPCVPALIVVRLPQEQCSTLRSIGNSWTA